MTLKQALYNFGLNAKIYAENKKTQDLVRPLLDYETPVVFNELKNVIAYVVTRTDKFQRLPSRHYFLQAVRKNLQTQKHDDAPMHPDVAALVNDVLKKLGHRKGL